MLIIVVTMFVVLFAFLAGGLWIGWTLGATGTTLLAVFRRISLAELMKRGYSKDVAVGSLAGSGTLGFLIPPSNIMIIYGVLGDVSIAKLFTAGFIPGFLLAGCFMAWIMLHTALKPEMVPAAERMVRVASRAEFATSVRELGPAVFLILCVLGSMYGGLATPSEAA